MTPRSRIAALALSFSFLILAGCRSHVIVVTIANHSGAAIQNLEVTYPGGSFGKASLAESETYSYRIKTLRNGGFAITYLDAAGRSRSKKGPALQANAEGALDVEIRATDINFDRH